jgi:hypothetical protein
MENLKYILSIKTASSFLKSFTGPIALKEWQHHRYDVTTPAASAI